MNEEKGHMTLYRQTRRLLTPFLDLDLSMVGKRLRRKLRTSRDGGVGATNKFAV
jgi:hypothetical protein